MNYLLLGTSNLTFFVLNLKNSLLDHAGQNVIFDFTFILEVAEILQFPRMASLHKIPTSLKAHFRNVKGAGKSPLQKIPEKENVHVTTSNVQAPRAPASSYQWLSHRTFQQPPHWQCWLPSAH